MLRRQRHAPGCTGLLRWCQAGPDQPGILPVREGRPERQMDPPRGHRHAHRDPEQALAQRRWVAPAQDGGYREVPEPVLHHAIEGMGQCDQPEPECVDVPEAAGASVQEQIVLLLLDPVFGRAPVAVHRFVDRLRVGLLERGDDEATVVPGFADRRTWAFRAGLRSAVGLAGRFPVRVADRLSRQPFGLGDHAAFAAPAVARAIAEALVAADRLLRIVRIPLQPVPQIVHQRLDPVFQPIIARQSQHVIHAARRAPRHQLVAAVGPVGADQDRHLRKSLPQPVHERRDRLHHARRHIATRRAQFRPHRPAVAEHQPRKVAVCMVVPVIEPMLLPAVQFHVRGIDVQHQPLRHLAPLATHQIQLHEQLVERIEIHGDLTRFRRVPPVRRQLHPVQRAFAGQRLAVRTRTLHPPHGRGQGPRSRRSPS